MYAAQPPKEHPTLMESLSNKKRKAATERAGKYRKEMRERYNRKRARGNSASVPETSPPDQQVIDWVESLAGDPFPSGKVNIDMDPSLWKSPI